GGGSYGFATAGGAGTPSRSTLTTNAAAQYGFSGNVAATTAGSGPLACGAAGCSVNLRGGLFGPDAARLGLSYQVQSPAGGSTISGVGVFAQQPASQWRARDRRFETPPDRVHARSRRQSPPRQPVRGARPELAADRGSLRRAHCAPGRDLQRGRRRAGFAPRRCGAEALLLARGTRAVAR